MSNLKVSKYNFFVSKHEPPGNYNELHPCNIVRSKWREQGWYFNSFYRMSKFKGVVIGNVSFGLVSGYRKYRIPYIAYHYEGGFTMPAWMLPGTPLYFIRCTYAERNTWIGNIKLFWDKYRK